MANSYPNSKERRDGSVLLVVLVVIAALTFGVYAYSDRMQREYRSLRVGLDDLHAFQIAESGVQLTAAQLANGRGLPDVASKSWTSSAGSECTTRVLASWSDIDSGQVTGPRNECSKLNVHSLSLNAEDAMSARQRLLALPGMTAIAADSMLDWLDSDEDPREFGAESSWYLAQGFPYVPRQGKVSDLKELLLVRGITTELLFGLDSNANGWLESSEESQRLGSDMRHITEVERFGWSSLLTTNSAMSNYDAQGNLKACVNDANLGTLYRQLDRIVGREAARFIIAIRMNGPISDDVGERFDSREGTTERKLTASQRAKEQSSAQVNIETISPETIEGFSIFQAGTFQIQSLTDLIARRTEATINGQTTILQSPWNGSDLSKQLEWLENHFSISSGPVQIGQIDPRWADQRVLLTIPGMTESIARSIVQTRTHIDGDHGSNGSYGWLVERNVLSLNQLRKFAPYLCARGDVWTGFALGQTSHSSRAAVVSFQIDHSGRALQILSVQRRGMIPNKNTRDGLK